MSKSTDAKLDKFLNLFELQLTDAEVFSRAKSLFPHLNEGGPFPIDETLTDVSISLYAYNRGLGLTRKESAHAAEFSFTLVMDLYVGKGVSIDLLRQFIKEELYTKAYLQKKHMQAIEDGGDPAKDPTMEQSKTFLKMSSPKRYNDSTNIVIAETEEEDALQEEDKSIEKMLEERGIPQPDLDCEDIDEDVEEDTL